MKIQQNVNTLPIRLSHPQVEHLQRRLADQLRVERSVDVHQLIDRRFVVQDIRHERQADGVEAKTFDLRDLFLPTHIPKMLRLENLRVETEMADTANLNFLTAGINDLARLCGVT